MSIVDQAVWIIERNLDRSLNLDAIARACHVSRSHLANAFGSATGISVMKYLRARRLSQAAHALAGGAPDILAVALDAGYGSHEAFTRAFRDQFTLTPESVRAQCHVDGLALMQPLPLHSGQVTVLQAPRLEHQDRILVVGLSEPCSFETTIAIPAQWQRFMAFYEVIAYKSTPIPVGINQAPDGEGQFDYLCGVEVTQVVEPPLGLQSLEIAPSRYAVFEHRGHVSALYRTYAAIWNEALPAMGCEVADEPILERHNPTFDPTTGEGGLTLWIPLAE